MDHLIQTLGIGLIVPDLVLVLALGTGRVSRTGLEQVLSKVIDDAALPFTPDPVHCAVLHQLFQLPGGSVLKYLVKPADSLFPGQGIGFGQAAEHFLLGFQAAALGLGQIPLQILVDPAGGMGQIAMPFELLHIFRQRRPQKQQIGILHHIRSLLLRQLPPF